MPEVLLFALKRALGTGGNMSGPGVIEIQGSKQALVEAHLLDCPHQLKGVAGLREVKKGAGAAGAAAVGDGQLPPKRAAAAGSVGVVDAPRPGDAEGRRAKPRWDRRDKESEKRFVATGCGCSWIYCLGTSCKEVLKKAGQAAEVRHYPTSPNTSPSRAHIP
jgi:hypothetical protein